MVVPGLIPDLRVGIESNRAVPAPQRGAMGTLKRSSSSNPSNQYDRFDRFSNKARSTSQPRRPSVGRAGFGRPKDGWQQQPTSRQGGTRPAVALGEHRRGGGGPPPEALDAAPPPARANRPPVGWGHIGLATGVHRDGSHEWHRKGDCERDASERLSRRAGVQEPGQGGAARRRAGPRGAGHR